jgi:TfoX/Sxy family transcriptional regulator of competence genes
VTSSLITLVSCPGRQGRAVSGSAALKVNGTIFAMLGNGRFVVKLPADRVDALIGCGICEPYDVGKGRPLKKRATIAAADDACLGLARQAYNCVASKRR